MSFPKIRERCRKCGGEGVLYRDTEPYPSWSSSSEGGLFSVVCKDCGEESTRWCRPAPTIREWNYTNAVPEKKGGAE